MFKKIIFCLLVILMFTVVFSLPAWASEIANDDPAAPGEEETTTDEQPTVEEEPAEDNTAQIYYQYSSTWTNTLIHEITITNNSSAVAFNITVDVPLMDNHTPVYATLNDEIFDPLPQEITTDANGHRFAHYTIPYLYGNQSVTLTMRFIVNNSSLSYTFNRAEIADQYSDTEMVSLASYLLPGEGVFSTDPAIIQFTQQAIGDDTDPYQKALDIFCAVNLYLDYDSTANDQSSTAVLERGTAYCQGYTNLFLACLRAAGIPARQQSGYLYMPQKHTTPDFVDEVNGRIRLNSLRHTWVEFYLPNIGWVTADPTFTYTYEINGNTEKFVDMSYFANISSDKWYIFFREGSLSDELINFSATGGNVNLAFNSYLMFGSHRNSFSDIDGHWAQSAVTYCVGNELFAGTSATTFAPDRPMTRAMFITVIGRLYEMLSGETITAPAITTFQDTDSESYYAPYLTWCYQNGLITGYGNGNFGPDDNVTREQMTKIITDFAAFMGKNTAIYEGALLQFSDSNTISDWAHLSVAFCSNEGLITGMPGNIFSPKTSSTRAQVATVIQRLSLLLGE